MSDQPRATYREIALTIFLKTLPLVAATVVLFKFARSSVPVVAALPSSIYNAALVFALLAVARLTTGKLLARLARERGIDRGQAAG